MPLPTAQAGLEGQRTGMRPGGSRQGVCVQDEGPGDGGLVARVLLKEELAQPAGCGKVTRAA